MQPCAVWGGWDGIALTVSDIRLHAEKVSALIDSRVNIQ